MSEKITLKCPEGAWDYNISHGTEHFKPYRADIYSEDEREFGGPWLADVPIHTAHYFCHNGGFTVYKSPETGLVESSMEPAEIALKRLRKTDGSYAGCSWRGQSFTPDGDGIVTVPHLAVGELVESHGFEEVPEAPAQIDAALDDLSAGVAAEQEKVEALREEALTQVPEEQAEAARAQIEEERHDSPPQDYRTQRRSPRH